MVHFKNKVFPGVLFTMFQATLAEVYVMVGGTGVGETLWFCQCHLTMINHQCPAYSHSYFLYPCPFLNLSFCLPFSSSLPPPHCFGLT